MTCRDCLHYGVCYDRLEHWVNYENAEIKCDAFRGKSKFVKALEKSIPKQPNTEIINRGIDISGEYDIDSNYLCPSCNSVIGNCETEEMFFKFCPECGQALLQKAKLKELNV